MAEDVFKIRVRFDDGQDIEVGVRQRDILRLEELDAKLKMKPDGTIATGLRHVPMLAWLALQRTSRRGELPDGFVMPADFDEFRDICDVEAEGDEGEVSAPEPDTTG